MKKIFILLALICIVQCCQAKQILSESITYNTVNISAQKTGELGKNYFYCSNGSKCSTEQVFREHYKNQNYKVMRAEYSFWKGMFALTFIDELYPQTLDNSSSIKFIDKPLSNVPQEKFESKCKKLRKTDLQNFINNQIFKHELGSYIRWLDEWEIEGYKNPTEYFKSALVQEFLTKVDNKVFYNVMKQIIKTPNHNPLGTPDYIIWNENGMIFVEVKRNKEKLSPEQIEWGKFLIKNKIPYKVVRVFEI